MAYVTLNATGDNSLINIQQIVNNAVDSKISKKTDSLMKKLDESVNNKLSKYSQDQIPVIVKSTMSSVVPKYLNDSIKMNEILTKHSETLQHDLSLRGNAMLEKLVGDDKYHIVTNMNIAAGNQKFDTSIAICENGFALKMLEFDGKFNDEISSMKERVDKEITQVVTLNKRMAALESENRNLKNDITTLQTNYLIGFVTLVIGTAYCIYNLGSTNNSITLGF